MKLLKRKSIKKNHSDRETCRNKCSQLDAIKHLQLLTISYFSIMTLINLFLSSYETQQTASLQESKNCTLTKFQEQDRDELQKLLIWSANLSSKQVIKDSTNRFYCCLFNKDSLIIFDLILDCLYNFCIIINVDQLLQNI